MPTVPRKTGPSVQQQGIRGGEIRGRVDSADFGGGIARAAADVTDQAANIYQRERARMDKVAVQDALNTIDRFKIQELDPAAELRDGKNALGMAPELTGHLDKKANEIAESLADDRQRQAFMQSYGNMRNGALSQYTGKEYQERKKYANGTLEASNERYMNNMLSDLSSVDNIEQNRANILAAKREQAQLMGLGEEQTALYLQEADSNVVARVVDHHLSNGNYQGANAFYEQAGDLLIGEQAVNVQRALEQEGVKYRAQEASDRVIAEGMGYQEGLDTLNEIDDPDERAKAKSLLKQHHSERKEAEQIRANDTYKTALSQIEESGGNFYLDSEQRAAIGAGKMKQLESYATHVRNGTAITSDIDVLYRLSEEAVENPRKFMKRDILSDFRMSLSDSDLMKLRTLQDNVIDAISNGGSSSSSSVPPALFTNRQITDQVFEQNFGETTGKSDPKTVARYRQLAERRHEQFVRENGREPTGAEWRKAVEAAAGEFVVKESRFGQDWLNKDEGAKFAETDIDDIPAEDAQGIRSAIQAAYGYDADQVTDQMIVDTFVEQMMGAGQ